MIFKTVSEYGGTALMTSHQHESGSDRILEALEKFDHEKKYKNIIHLQGDLPNISGNLIQKLAQVANDPLKEITTVIVKASPDEFDDPSVVKVATTFTNNNPKVTMLEEHYILVEHVFQLEVKIFGIILGFMHGEEIF